MMSYVARSSSLAPHLRVVSQAVASQIIPLASPVVQTADKRLIVDPPELHTLQALNGTVPAKNTGVSITSGLAVPTQVRYAHTDIRFPDFDNYRRDIVKDPKSNSRENADSRRAFTYMILASGGVVGVYGTKAIVTYLVSSMSASADVLAMAKIEVKLADVPEGKNMTFKWRGKPLFVRHRSPLEIEEEQKVDVSTLRDPQHDSERSPRPEWLIVVGVCTHLGCVPIANAGDFGGYYCPCHGSHYDASGRIRKGPAPLNLEIPEHTFVDDMVIIG